jgi:tetratricopeptide (TPR) repeat protein
LAAAGPHPKFTALDSLFGALHATTEAGEARRIERQIWQLWIASGSDTIDLLMHRGAQAMAQGDYQVALDMFDRIVELDPEFAEGWNKRATLYYLMGAFEASVADIQRTLGLEPRHFGALSGLGMIYSALDDDERALKAYRKALEANPHLSGARAAVIRLRKKLKGEGI